MEIIDKRNFLPNITDEQYISLELGCGNRKKISDSIGIDILDYPCVDVVGDIYLVLAKFPDNSVNEVHSYHFFEHVSDVPMLLSELARILKKNGKLVIVVPHFSNPYFYSDLTHKAFFGLYSMSYFAKDEYLSRKVPTYQRTMIFSIDDVHLGFKSTPPFYIRHGFKKIIELLVNLNTYTKEVYEEMFCYLFPCYEIRYELRRI